MNYRRKEPALAIQWDGTLSTFDEIQKAAGKFADFWIRVIGPDEDVMPVLRMECSICNNDCACIPGAWVVFEKSHRPYFMDDKDFHARFEQEEEYEDNGEPYYSIRKKEVR